ncbi:MAG: pyruvate dehydrogenase (acetyl-transferring), homodimeric type [Pseudomonadales bacterium]|nr:pyruvate dehydrogenase (acetyl-transferring), homodimeric type [Pseudomonadales bacterium]MBL6808305.1 pyruvate dehydrogenase (acetyl-transferring), homodimeric type [Pseudomonadales bacterium]
MAKPISSLDPDPQETREWLEALEGILAHQGTDRARYLLARLSSRMTETGESLPYTVTTPYRNTIPVSREARMPGDLFMERQLRSLIRWNALAMVMRANADDSGVGGHIASFASSATLYDVGFNYFWRAPTEENPGDLIYIQGHSSPGIYARSFLEGRLQESDLDRFRREADGQGLSSYPHPWLMRDYWQFPTVSMGLGPLQAIYQAHVMKYLDSRGQLPMGDRKIWAFLGDGECDEPETLGSIALAGRESLDNLIFVVNCNLQRLDGPVRGNGKIIQELEGVFRGAGWNVIKVIWGRHWDPILEADDQGLLQQRMDEVVDGEYQNYKAKGGAYTREHFFGKHPELKAMVAHLSDDDIMRLNRGGHDPYKIFAAYHAAVNHRGQPTVILAKTVKGYGMGDSIESENTAHQTKKLTVEALRRFRDRFDVPLSDAELEQMPYYRPKDDSPELRYMTRQRDALGGPMPQRRVAPEGLPIPSLEAFKAVLDGSGERAISTTMAFVRILSALLRDKALKERIVPIVPDEARTFGMEGMFRQLGIYSSEGQLYEPEDSGELAPYKESKDGQVLEEGITEAGAFSAWLAAATSYSVNQFPLVPFYIFYSMFGFQRIGDLAWAAGDAQARGFLLGATAGRTTLNGEGLQHQDGHSHLLASTIPNCIAYDPAYGYELAVIIQDGLRRMIAERESVFYYITVMNENYPQPALPAGAEPGILRGLYCLTRAEARKDTHVRLLGSGTILREVLAAVPMLEAYGVSADVYSVTSFNELRRDGLAAERHNLLHPDAPPTVSWVAEQLGEDSTPVIASSDYMKVVADQIRPFVPAPYRVLGTDGYGRSDTREKLRDFFEVDRRWVTLAALKSLVDAQKIPAKTLLTARDALGIDPDKPDPVTV